jgi:ubiquinone/menaquinone biosynthesis C-methylase UbiE
MERTRIENIFYKLNPEYRHRYEIYNELLVGSLSENIVWLDIGCGLNDYVADFGHNAKSALGIDVIIDPRKTGAPFLQADLRNIPLPSSSADLITLRMVVEHLANISNDLSEIERLLKPGGKLIVLTTNVLSPTVFLPRLLPFSIKKWIILKMFKVDNQDVFPTHHKFNTPAKIRKGFGGMKLIRLEFLEEVPLPQPFLTAIFGVWYSLTKLPVLRRYRSNLLAVYEKK